MIGLGTIINTAAILVGGLFGALFGRFLHDSAQDTLTKVCGVSTLFIAITGVLEKMLRVENGFIVSSGSMLIIGSLAIGALVGEWMNIEGAFERFGEWLKIKSGNAKDKGFVNAFVTASLTVCIGAMAIVGSIQDGLTGDYSILATKAILDLIIIMVMSCSLGKGAVFSAIPVAVVPGEYHPAGGLCAASHDRCSPVESVSGGQCTDFLRGTQSCLGKESQSCQSAACHPCCGHCCIFTILTDHTLRIFGGCFHCQMIPNLLL